MSDRMAEMKQEKAAEAEATASAAGQADGPAAPAAAASPSPVTNGGSSSGEVQPRPVAAVAATAMQQQQRQQLSQQPSASSIMMSEDERMKRFFRLLAYTSMQQGEDPTTGLVVSVSDKGAAAGSDREVDSSAGTIQQQIRSGSTVPTALCRRIIHRQGGGYLDETVAAVAAGAADRFLATVLQQSSTCRELK